MTESAPASVDGVIFRDPARPELKRRPLHAWKHFRKLLANKEETRHVFEIFRALPPRGAMDRAREFCLSENGKALFRTERPLVPVLDDHDELRRLGEDTVAAAYVRFMRAEGLSAAGLTAEYDGFLADKPKFDDMVEWYHSRGRDTHDLLHVLTGYGRDALGEQCVLAFTYGQDRTPGHLLIAYAGAVEIMRMTHSRAPVLRAVREAQRLGRGCPAVSQMSIKNLLATPLAEAREKLGIGTPRYYDRCHEIWRAQGRDPYKLLAAPA